MLLVASPQACFAKRSKKDSKCKKKDIGIPCADYVKDGKFVSLGELEDYPGPLLTDDNVKAAMGAYESEFYDEIGNDGVVYVGQLEELYKDGAIEPQFMLGCAAATAIVTASCGPASACVINCRNSDNIAVCVAGCVVNGSRRCRWAVRAFPVACAIPI